MELKPEDADQGADRGEDYVAWCRRQAAAVEAGAAFDRSGVAGELRSIAETERHGLFESVTALLGCHLAREAHGTGAPATPDFAEDAARLVVDVRRRLQESPSLKAEAVRHWEQLYRHGCLRAALLLDIEAAHESDAEEAAATADMLDLVASFQQLRWLSDGTTDAEERAHLQEACRNAVSALTELGVLPEHGAATANGIETGAPARAEAGPAAALSADFPDRAPYTLDALLALYED